MGTIGMLKSAGVGAGDEVIVSAYGNVELAEAVLAVRALPVFADIDGETYCLDAGAAEAAVTSRTAAIVGVKRFGSPAGMGRLEELGRRRGLLVVEHREEADADPSAVARRRVHAAYLDGRLTGVRTPVVCEGHGYQQYVVRVPGNGRPDRDAFAHAVRRRGVNCHVPVKTPVHRLPDFQREVCLPETERAADETLALPIGGELSRRDLQRVVAACNALGGLLQPAF
ncbi:DegT/DnrJ/EryC1/StrS family aminotransferase [Streptomyces sp. ISL-98]|uniref:DegT/DnrJ/EryC1/StrS family aminotransferase n=1 Tax=Streptomyces sp. ISL-98 TaxID=2819192 RepID=UPI001BEA01AB|nr:DegT/DnrJ/EryC1/StrS family aminotransferase [Streptomyces sp. ISL-98]MBT2511204.1 DegT/DnrJ/EryC1/StrS family aminotransferase [Streptomyces sp. ISL-98]